MQQQLTLENALLARFDAKHKPVPGENDELADIPTPARPG